MVKNPLNNYFDLLVDEKIDSISKCPVCIDGICDILDGIYDELKIHYKGGQFQRFLRIHLLYGIYHWKENYHPVPISKLKLLLALWKKTCNKNIDEYGEILNRIFQKATYFKACRSPVKVKVIRFLDTKLVYLLGVIYADGALRDIWLTQRNEGRFRFEISITDEKEENLKIIVDLLKEQF